MGSTANPLGGAPGTNPASSYDNNLYLLGENQQQAQNTAQPVGNQNVGAASTNLGAAANYDLGILSGDRSQILATEAPEISSLLSSYDAARKSAGQLTPRGGGRSAELNELPYKEAGDVNKLVESARPEAARNLTQIANSQALLGEGEQQIASNDVQSSLSFLLGKAGVQLNEAQLQSQQGQLLGQSVGAALPQLLTLLQSGG
jgi:hypothetical protein